MSKKKRLKKLRVEEEEKRKLENSCQWCGSGSIDIPRMNELPNADKYKPMECGSIPSINSRGVVCRIKELENRIKQLETIVLEDDNEQTQKEKEKENTEMPVV